ncbi:hypothetical protein GCM10007362_20390 [Saccharibacillus endophyticus]|uniref:Uncharacterized protein n=1 Tax=Saccharibacillus endophyticus TaxID=2060666 RepID=A0ABQ1ZRJ4_9BACL|nr:hypothetical protein GCM10007362_20390 [Saccharibacillus endophyticus]
MKDAFELGKIPASNPIRLSERDSVLNEFLSQLSSFTERFTAIQQESMINRKVVYRYTNYTNERGSGLL